MSVETLAKQCVSFVVDNITNDSLKFPFIPPELCQEIISYILRDRRLKRQEVTYLQTYWATTLTRLLTSSSLSSILSLDFTSSTIPSPLLELVCVWCPSLVALNLSSNKLLSSKSVSYLGKLKSLQYLNLSKCPLVDSNCLISLSKYSFDLQSLNLEKCNITDPGIIAIASAFPNLRTLILSYCGSVSDTAICKLADSCPKLEVLNFKMCRRLSDKSIGKIFSQLSELNSINLENCQRITDNSFTTFACPKLSIFNINFCDRVTTKSLLRVSEVATHLETIRVQQIQIKEEEGIRELSEFIQRCKFAKKLNIVGSSNRAITTEIFSQIENCKELKSLSFGSNILDDSNPSPDILSPELSLQIFFNLSQLEKILFAGVPVSPQTISTMAKHCKHVKQIHFRFCRGFSDEVVDAISGGFPDLARLTILSGDLVTNRAVVDLCKRCPNLEELKLIGCPRISDPTVAAVPALKKLQRLILSDSKITNECIKNIITCVQLRELDLSGCSLLSPQAVEVLTSRPVSASSSSPLPPAYLSKLERFSWESMLWMKDEHVTQIISAFPLLNQLYLSGCPNVSGNAVEVKDMDLVVYLERKNLQLSMSM